MARRQFDAYPTQAKVTNALVDRVHISGGVCEPCVGAGQLADVIWEDTDASCIYTNDVDNQYNVDRNKYGGVHYTDDATLQWASIWGHTYDWTITNPPYNTAIDILRNSWNSSHIGVVFLLRLTFLEPTGVRSGDRGLWLREHEDNMTHLITMGQPRPSFTNDGKTDSATVAWMIWQRDWSWRRRGIRNPFQFAMRWNI